MLNVVQFLFQGPYPTPTFQYISSCITVKLRASLNIAILNLEWLASIFMSDHHQTVLKF